MANRSKLIICGFSGGGKSTLFRLLDGHSQVCGSQLHERLSRIFYFGKGDLDKYSGKRNLRSKALHLELEIKMATGESFLIGLPAFRILLANYTNYGSIEVDAEHQKTFTSASSDDLDQMSFHFDFNQFERQWKERLFKAGAALTPEQIHDRFYESFFESWTDYPVSAASPSILTFCGPEEPEFLEFILKENFNAKVIFIDREIEGTFATHVLRAHFSKDLPEDRLAESKRLLIQNGSLWRLASRRHRLHEIAKKHPEKILMIDFNALILDTEKTMRSLCEFSGMKWEPTLMIPTHLGVPLREKPGHEYLGKVNDVAGRVLDQTDRKLIQMYESKAAGKGSAWISSSPSATLQFARTEGPRSIRESKAQIKRYIKRLGLHS